MQEKGRIGAQLFLPASSGVGAPGWPPQHLAFAAADSQDTGLQVHLKPKYSFAEQLLA
jgi:hypothetical protein